jgi:hypothetical protein
VDVVVLFYNKRFNSLDYTEASVIKESVFQNQQFNEKEPAFINSLIRLETIEDEIAFMQLG